MTLTIAIHPDNYTSSASPEKSDASSPLWAEYLQKAGHEVKWVDVRRADILDQLAGCHGFMWRWAHFAGMGRIARRLLPVIEHELGLVTYPDQRTSWHYDDKIAQAYLLPAAGIPSPKTWVWFDQGAATSWATTAQYPLVLKLATGAGSRNVRLVESVEEAHFWIERLFKQQMFDLDPASTYPLPWRTRVKHIASIARRGRPAHLRAQGAELQNGYALFQEFLPNNAFDTRVTVVGNRAFAFRRFNRPNDFRASGSGLIDWDTSAIDMNFVRLAFQTTHALQTQSCAIDGLYRGGEHVGGEHVGGDHLVGEVSYTYVSWAVQQCPGHWQLHGSPATGEMTWIPGEMWPEEAQIQDFLVRLDQAHPAQ